MKLNSHDFSQPILSNDRMAEQIKYMDMYECIHDKMCAGAWCLFESKDIYTSVYALLEVFPLNYC